MLLKLGPAFRSTVCDENHLNVLVTDRVQFTKFLTEEGWRGRESPFIRIADRGRWVL